MRIESLTAQIWYHQCQCTTCLKTRQGKDCTMSNHTSGAIQLELTLFATVGYFPSLSFASRSLGGICSIGISPSITVLTIGAATVEP